MNLHEEDIAILEHEMEQLQPYLGALARSIEARMMLTDPSLAVLFQLPLINGGSRVAQTVSSLVSSLRRPAVLGPMLADLGAKFARRGVRERDYEALARVVMEAVADVLGDELTDSSQVAWRSLADQTQDALISGAREAFVSAVAL